MGDTLVTEATIGESSSSENEFIDCLDEDNHETRTLFDAYFLVLVSLFITNLFAVFIYIVKVLVKIPLTNEIERTGFFKYEIILYVLLAFLTWIAVSIYLFIANIREREEFSLVGTMYKVHSTYLKIVTVLIFTAGFISASYFVISKQLKGGQGDVDAIEAAKNITFYSRFVQSFPSISIGVALFVLLIFIKDMIVSLTAIKLHYIVYKERIKHSEKYCKVIETLNRCRGQAMKGKLKDWALSVFRCISKDGRSITEENLLLMFDQSLVDSLYEFLEITNSRKIGKKEFINVYKSIYREKALIKNALAHKRQLFKKLDILLCFLFYPFAFVTVRKVVNLSFEAFDILNYTQLFLSGKFIFEDVVKEVFSSFVYIFFVGLYDVGDKLLINNDLYEVVDIGILYSEFIRNSKLVMISNTRLMGFSITNLRVCDIKEEIYRFKIQTDDTNFILRELEKALDKHTKNSKYFNERFKVMNYSSDKDKIQTIDVSVSYKVNNDNHDSLKEEGNAVKIPVASTLDKNGAQVIKG